MDDDLDLRHFAGRCRLFPLPRVVMFPHVVLPLHIFEPRYRQMTEDALAGDRLVTMVQLRPSTLGTVGAMGSPPIETVACLGRILQHERLPDGRFNFLLLGRKRVRLRHELSTDRLYRVAEADILDDLASNEPEEPRRHELARLFRTVFSTQGKLAPELSSLMEGTLSLGVLTDIVGHALGLAPEVKQQLLGELCPVRRADTLIQVLSQASGRAPQENPAGRLFPPPFSPN